MTNDITTLEGALAELGETMATNLSAKGVSADAEDGLMALASKILDIEGGGETGITLTTDITCNVCSNAIDLGDSITITGALQVLHDIKNTNEAIVGVIQTAPIKIYNENTLLYTVYTDNNGEYTYTYTPAVEGNLSIRCNYEGDSFYSSSNSGSMSVTVEENIIINLDLTSDKQIISHYDSETATLTATASHNGVGMNNIAVTFKNGNTILNTVTTDSSGEAEYVYTSQGAGEITITAECDGIEGTYELIDAKYHASNSVVDSYGPSYANNRYLCVLPYPIQVEDKIHFRFKSIPNKTIIGVGSTAGSDLTVEKNGSTYNIWRNVVSSQSKVGSAYTFSIEHDFILYKTSQSGYSNKVGYLYNGDSYIDWWQMGSSINRIRVDKFFNDDYEIEVFVL